jgi:zygote arrest protein 1
MHNHCVFVEVQAWLASMHTIAFPVFSFFFFFSTIYRCTTERLMFRSCFTLLALRPREMFYTPPPLVRRPAKFSCRVCSSTWDSHNVWVTKTTQKCYQGETCEECGTSNKPYYIGREEESIFNRRQSPHPVKYGASTKRSLSKLTHNRFDRRVKRTH